MPLVNFEYVWKFLESNKVETGNDTKDLTCVICCSTLINPRLTICNCACCFTCVKEYMEYGIKICPGKRDNCKIELLSVDILDRTDDTLNEKISKLLVKCPAHLCDFKTEVGMMEDHEKVCKQAINDKQTICGSTQNNVVHNEVFNHLAGVNELNAKLSMKHIDVLKNAVSDMEKDFLNLKDEMREMRAMRENQKKVAEQREREIEQLELEMQAVKEESKLIKEERQSLQLELERHRAEFLELMAAIQEQLTVMRAQDKSKHEKMNNWDKGID